jgi:prepilin-type N-terminal cleavage/methylation domain-containing protein
MKGKKIYKDNKGMSLVEVIISITILSVVIVPVLQALTTAMVYNSKARVRQNLTVTAESIMETFKGYSLESLETMFASSESVAGLSDCTYNCEKFLYDEIDGKKIYEYKFTITGFEQNGKSYNAVISVEPNVTKKVYESKDISTTTNAVFQSDRDYDKNLKNSMYNTFIGDDSEVAKFYNVFKQIENDKAGYGADSEYVFKGLKIYPGDVSEGTEITEESLKSANLKNYIKIYDRTTTVNANGKTATVSIEYHYKIENYPYVVMRDIKTSSGSSDDSGDVDLNPDLTFEGESTYEEENREITSYPESGYLTYSVSVKNAEIYNNANGNLERLYMYYFPLYEKDGGSMIKDIIKINNNAGNDFNLYLIKQVAPDLTVAKITEGEKAYAPNIEFAGSGIVNIYHNLNTNLATGKNEVGGYTISSNFNSSGDYTAISEFVEQEVLNYLVTVTIDDGTNEVSRLESTMNEKIK